MTDERNETPENDQFDSWRRPEDFSMPGAGLFDEEADLTEEYQAPVSEPAAETAAGPERTAEQPGRAADPVTGNGSYTYSAGSYEDLDSTHSRRGFTGSLRYEKDPHAGSGAGRGSAGRADGTRKRSGGKAVFAVLLAAIFGLCAGLGAWGAGSLLSGDRGQSAAVSGPREESAAEDENSSDETIEAEPEESAGQQEPQFVMGSGAVPATDISSVAEFVMPSIVSVYNNYIAQEYYFGRYFEQEAQSTGSGIIIATTDTEMLIVTNNHVVADADSLKVRFIDDTEAEANLKGTDASNDLAVLAVSLEDLDESTRAAITVATLGSSETLKVGQDAIAIGNALGYGQSVTRGIVSAVNRQIESEDGITGTFIQTDAAINPGNSGGALVNINGEVIGINSSKIGGSTVEGMGFAIPISEAKPIIEDLMTQQTRRKVASEEQGTLGISGATVTNETQRYYGIPGGVYVAQILEGGAAESSDLQKGDVITGINGTDVNSMENLKKQLQYYEAGTEVTLTVQRQGENGEYSEMQVTLTLGSQEILGSAEEQTEEKESGFMEGQRPDTGRGFGSGSGEDGGMDFGWPFSGFGEDDGDE